MHFSHPKTLVDGHSHPRSELTPLPFHAPKLEKVLKRPQKEEEEILNKGNLVDAANGRKRVGCRMTNRTHISAQGYVIVNSFLVVAPSLLPAWKQSAHYHEDGLLF